MKNLRKLLHPHFSISADSESSDFKTNISEQVAKWLNVGCPLNRLRINPAFIGTGFLLRVLFWTWLIPFGQIVTYEDIARWMKKPGASRAVGRALHNNPLPIFIPCHRVIGKDGNLTGFSAGLSLKKQLLRLEGHRTE
ncbi:MAG: MGMT family protein [Candidatus Marinimicrobia bacterium]|nr:MGMT family protein [Candidatus Neomarinimicrobiota bacterium]